MARKPYPSDVTDDEWMFVAPYLTLMREDAPQREHDLREVFNGMRYVVRAGEAWRMMPNDLPPWAIVYQQARRWIAAGVFGPTFGLVLRPEIAALSMSGSSFLVAVNALLLRRLRLPRPASQAA